MAAKKVFLEEHIGRGLKKDPARKKVDVDLTDFVDGTSLQYKNGKLTARNPACRTITDLNQINKTIFGGTGVFCIQGNEKTLNMPAGDFGASGTAARGTSTGSTIDWVGEVVISDGEVVVYVGNQSDVWESTNDSGDANDTTNWSSWRKLAIGEAPRTNLSARNGVKINGTNIELDYNTDDFEIVSGKVQLKTKPCLEVTNVSQLTQYKGVHCVYLRDSLVTGTPTDPSAPVSTPPTTAPKTGSTIVWTGTWTGTNDGGHLVVSERTSSGGAQDGMTFMLTIEGTNLGEWQRLDNQVSATPASPTESRFVDVRVAATTNKHQIGEGDTADIIYTVTNTGSATASLVTLDITNAVPSGKRLTYGTYRVDKAKAGAVTKVNDTRYTIASLESGGSVAITIPTTYQDFGAFTHSVVGKVSADNVDKSADDNRGSVQIQVTSTRDSSYQPTTACPALRIVDVDTAKTLLLMDYGAATYVTNRNQFQQEPPAQPATMNRLNVYAPGTTTIKLRADGAGTAVVHGFKLKPTTNGLQQAMDEAKDGEYSYLELSERSTGYDFNGRRFAVKPSIFVGTKSGDGASGGSNMLGSAIQRDKRTYFGSKPAGVTESFSGGVLTIGGLVPGTWLAVSFRPQGANCEWQTVLIAVPLDVTDQLTGGLKLTRKSGTASHITIASGLSNRADVSTGYLNINGNVSADTPIVPLDQRSSDKAIVNAPAGTANTYVLTVKGGTLNPNTTSTGNIKITPNSAGTELTIVVEATASAADNFIYRNNGVVVEMKVA